MRANTNVVLLIFFGIWLLVTPSVLADNDDDDGHSGGGNNQYDYVVVGAGSAGCIVATKLGEAGYRVKVIERGSRIPDDNINSQLLALATSNWVPPFTEDIVTQPDSLGKRPIILVAEVEGGGGMVNSAIAHLGAKGWWNSWGFPKWTFDANIRPAFIRLRGRLSMLPPAIVPDSARKFMSSGATISFLNNNLNDPFGTPTEGFGNLSLATKPSATLGLVRDSTLFAYLDKSSSRVSVTVRAHATRSSSIPAGRTTGDPPALGRSSISRRANARRCGPARASC